MNGAYAFGLNAAKIFEEADAARELISQLGSFVRDTRHCAETIPKSISRKEARDITEGWRQDDLAVTLQAFDSAERVLSNYDLSPVLDALTDFDISLARSHARGTFPDYAELLGCAEDALEAAAEVAEEAFELERLCDRLECTYLQTGIPVYDAV